MRCLFLAPMKPPDHPTPSGDRAMARLLMRLLEQIGFDADIASRLSARLRSGDDAEIDALVAASAAEAERILAAEEGRPRPRLVFAYHNYYKAPDLIGPAVARALAVPYVVAEASRAPKRAVGPFARAHALAGASIDAARLVFAFTSNDRAELERARPPHQAIVDLKPFIDRAAWPLAGAAHRAPQAPLRLLAVAMMRDGDKMKSYRALAAALARLQIGDWTLDIAGDGPGRVEVEELMAPFGARIRFLGRVDDAERLGALYASADIFVWPGVNEAYGVAYLEAQAHGAVCVAADHGGVRDAIADGRTGIIVAPDDPRAFADAIARLAGDAALLARMRREAARFIREERSLDAAAAAAASALRAIGALSGAEAA